MKVTTRVAVSASVALVLVVSILAFSGLVPGLAGLFGVGSERYPVSSSQSTAASNPTEEHSQQRTNAGDAALASAVPKGDGYGDVASWEQLLRNALSGDVESAQLARETVARCEYLQGSSIESLLGKTDANNGLRRAALATMRDKCRSVVGLTVDQADALLKNAADRGDEVAVASRLHEVEEAQGAGVAKRVAADIYASSMNPEAISLAAEHLRQSGWDLGAKELGAELYPGQLSKLQYNAIRLYECNNFRNCGPGSATVLETCVVDGACLPGADFNLLLRQRLLSQSDYERVVELSRMIRHP